MEILITLTQLSGGNYQPLNGLTGANIKFYYAPTGSVEKTGLTVVEKGNGTYLIEGFANDDSEYLLLKVDGVTQQSFGSQWIGGLPALHYMDGIGENIPAALAGRLKLDGSNSPAAHIGWGGFRLHNVGDPVSGIDVGDRDYNDARYVLASNYVSELPSRCLLVSNTAVAVAGKIYTSIQAAINYVDGQGANNGNYWKIYVIPHTNSITGYSENLTFQPNIKIIGRGLVKVSGSVSGFSQHTSFENIMFQHNGNMTLNGSAAFKDCIARLTGSSEVKITLGGINALNMGLITTHTNHTIESSGNNNITGWHTKEFELLTTDKVYTNLLNISDIDTASAPIDPD